jgi:hypothetical protein
LRPAAAGAGAAGIVCADEIPGTNCMPFSLAEPSVSQSAAKINPEIFITANKNRSRGRSKPHGMVYC